tara:strand:- start:358 stop:1641 length:1284 start_codon:yes stop_codon:yes gene_type:complete
MPDDASGSDCVAAGVPDAETGFGGGVACGVNFRRDKSDKPVLDVAKDGTANQYVLCTDYGFHKQLKCGGDSNDSYYVSDICASPGSGKSAQKCVQNMYTGDVQQWRAWDYCIKCRKLKGNALKEKLGNAAPHAPQYHSYSNVTTALGCMQDYLITGISLAGQHHDARDNAGNSVKGWIKCQKTSNFSSGTSDLDHSRMDWHDPRSWCGRTSDDLSSPGCGTGDSAGNADDTGVQTNPSIKQWGSKPFDGHISGGGMVMNIPGEGNALDHGRGGDADVWSASTRIAGCKNDDKHTSGMVAYCHGGDGVSCANSFPDGTAGKEVFTTYGSGADNSYGSLYVNCQEILDKKHAPPPFKPGSGDGDTGGGGDPLGDGQGPAPAPAPDEELEKDFALFVVGCFVLMCVFLLRSRHSARTAGGEDGWLDVGDY